MSYIGALGVNIFEDEIEDTVDTISASITIDINHTSNYVLTTSNILATRINDTSNVFVISVKDTSNYADRLDLCIKSLEGTEGSPRDISLTPPLPPIPPTGILALAAGIATVTEVCVAGNGITTLTLIDMLETKVDSNQIEADKIGGWSSNYSDKVGVWCSNYTGVVIIVIRLVCGVVIITVRLVYVVVITQIYK
jgi:hypothetical protein